MKEFYNSGSVADRGTMYNIKVIFKHKNAKTEVMDNFQHVWDFIEVQAIALYLLFFCN